MKTLVALPLAGGLASRRKSPAEKELGSDYILVNGWILKKTDLIDYSK